MYLIFSEKKATFVFLYYLILGILLILFFHLGVLIDYKKNSKLIKAWINCQN